MGALTREDARDGARGRRRRRGVGRASFVARSPPPRRADPARPRAREARHRHGPARHERRGRGARRRARVVEADERLELAGADDPLRHGGRARRRPLPRASSSASRRSSTSCKAAHPDVVVHAANSAATFRDAAAHFDMVRCGIAIYGLDPFQRGPGRARARAGAARSSRTWPPSSASSRATSAGYGRRWTAERADLGRRRSRSATATAGGAGSRTTPTCWSAAGAIRSVGTVSMDNITIDLGPGDRRRGRATPRC